MRVRLFELRLLAATLTTLWTIAAGLVLLGYRPGGPIDVVVGVVAMVPIPISLAGLVWPPAVRGRRAFAGVVWIGLTAILVLIPSIAAILGQLLARGPQTLLPSWEAAYPWLVALAATSLFAGLGIARRLLGQTAMRRRRLALGGTVAVVATLGSATLFASVAIANDAALRDRPAIASRLGPTGVDPAADACSAPIAAADSAAFALALEGDVDGASLGRIDLRGERQLEDGRWTADVATDAAIGQHGVARVGGTVWTREPGRPWQAASTASDRTDVDLVVLERVLRFDGRTAAEDLGLEYLEGARARHCRIAIDGPAFLAAFPQARWLTPARPNTGTPPSDTDLHRWRGDLDFWVFGDRQVGQVHASVSGEAHALGRDGLQGTLRARLTAWDRGTRHPIEAPVR
jgi:hypothetical protein